MQDLVERLARLPAAAVSDIQRNLQATYAMDAAIHGMVPGARVAGLAFTALGRAGSIITVHKALMEAPQGSVIVVGGGEMFQQPNGALFGKMMATQAKLRGIVGLVVDGMVRDIADLREMQFPIFARGATPHVGMNRVVGQTQVPVPCGGIIVNPGDYIVGDDDGVAVIPASLVEQVIAGAEERVRKEADQLERMKAGEQLADMIGFRELIYGKKS
jgi:4-hydroxy-4-methyl-2-oxoglutarate aldolase